MAAARTKYFDVLRVLATVSVVFLHINAEKFYSVDISSRNWLVFNISDSIVRWAVPIFVMISGALFLNPNRRVNIKRIYTANITRLATAFFFWAGVYYIVSYFYLDAKWEGYKSVLKALTVPNYLWFIPMIIGLYTLVPIFRKVTEDKKLTEYFLAVSFVLSVVAFNLIKVVLPLFRAGAIHETLSTFSTLYEKSCIGYLIQYSFYFVLGYYLSSIEFKKAQRLLIYLIGAIGFASTFLLTHFISHYKGSSISFFYQYFSLNVIMEAVSIFVVIKSIKWRDSFFMDKLLPHLSKISFGIYLSHMILIKLCCKYLFDLTTTTRPLTAVLCETLIVLLGSYVISLILSKIPLINKYVL